MSKKAWLMRIHWILPLVFFIWNISSVLLLLFLGRELPVMATNLLSLSFLPFLPLIPILRPLGLIAGYDSWVVPSVPGYALSLSFYLIVLFLLGRLLQAAFGRHFRESTRNR